MQPSLAVFRLGFGGRRAARNCKYGDQYQKFVSLLSLIAAPDLCLGLPAFAFA